MVSGIKLSGVQTKINQTLRTLQIWVSKEFYYAILGSIHQVLNLERVYPILKMEKMEETTSEKLSNISITTHMIYNLIIKYILPGKNSWETLQVLED